MKDKLTHSVCACVTVWYRQQWECIHDRSIVRRGLRSQSQDAACSFPTFCPKELLPICPMSCSPAGTHNFSSPLLCLTIIVTYDCIIVAPVKWFNLSYSPPRVGPGHPSSPLSIYFLIFSPFLLSLSLALPIFFFCPSLPFLPE